LTSVVPALRGDLADAAGRATDFARRSAIENDVASARQAASGLYFAVAAAVLAAEGTRLAASGDGRRLLLAALTLAHRLTARDPFVRVSGAFEDACAASLLEEQPVSITEVERVLALR